MKKNLFAVLAVALFAFGASAFADQKIGVLDLNKVMMDSPQVETAKTKLKSKFDAREKEMIAAQKSFQSDVEKFNKESATMKDDAKKAAQQKILDQQKKIQDSQSKFQNDLNTAQNDALKEIVKTIESVVNKIAAEKKFDLIIAKAGTAYNKPELEVTSEVVAQMKKLK